MSLKTAFARELYRARTKSGYSPAQIANFADISLRLILLLALEVNGIRVSSEGGESLLIDDVSCDRIFAEALAARCTQLQVSPAQLYDAVLDALA